MNGSGRQTKHAIIKTRRCLHYTRDSILAYAVLVISFSLFSSLSFGFFSFFVSFYISLSFSLSFSLLRLSRSHSPSNSQSHHNTPRQFADVFFAPFCPDIASTIFKYCGHRKQEQISKQWNYYNSNNQLLVGKRTSVATFLFSASSLACIWIDLNSIFNGNCPAEWRTCYYNTCNKVICSGANLC